MVYFDHDWNLHVGEKQLELLAPPGTDGPWTDTFKRLQIFQDLHGSNQSLVSKEQYFLEIYLLKISIGQSCLTNSRNNIMNCLFFILVSWRQG